ncbi:hypothetical protein GALL_474610 [mine drainage metagenome]|uniref:Uncharacterized protein n=1 Tax=mine drainage metagenome TaxID=410659 RepID=A0A1J5PTL1_9ZZZZ
MASLDKWDFSCIWHQKIHEGGVEQLPTGVVLHSFIKCPTDTLSNATVDLSFDDHWIDQAPAVMHYYVS